MRWNFKENLNLETVSLLMNVLQVEKPLAELLVNRNIDSFEDARKFFRPSLDRLHDPFLMKNMEKAVKRIQNALENKENILIYGDYDVDGTTAVSLVSKYLSTYSTQIHNYIPDRYSEGYGISFKGIDYANDNDFSLIIALDCGIKAIDKVNYANKKKIDFIICDHHRPGEQVPNAFAILNPKQIDCKYPFKELCGCGIGFKLIQAIHEYNEFDFNELITYLDLVATATAADIVPINGENRILAHFGLQVINESPSIGIKALIQNIKKTRLTITDVVFIIAPRINAAGRIKSGLHAVELLTETNEKQANEFAKQIESYNNDRKNLDKIITKEALQQIKNNKEENRVTSVVYQEDWHKGVIGIVASRLIENYYRPTLVFTKSGDYLAASARSVIGFDVYEALHACSYLIEQFGGHKYAAGLTLKPENYAAFKQKFEEVVKNTITPEQLEPVIHVDRQLNLSDITPKFHRILKQFAPFGPQNRKPVFMTSGLRDNGYGKPIGQENKHLRLNIISGADNKTYQAIGFNLGHKWDKIKNGKSFSICYTIEENHWNGRTTLQLNIKDLAVDS